MAGCGLQRDVAPVFEALPKTEKVGVEKKLEIQVANLTARRANIWEPAVCGEAGKGCSCCPGNPIMLHKGPTRGRGKGSQGFANQRRTTG